MTTKGHNYLKLLCKDFVERAETLGYKGKKRDDALMDYFTGAVMLAKHMGDEETYNFLGGFVAMVFSVRGYDEVKHLAQLEDKE